MIVGSSEYLYTFPISPNKRGRTNAFKTITTDER
jgi:hypothetical protein